MRFVVTAGPTREAIDPVRFISNRSSGKMGYAIAEAALAKKHEVTLISGPTCLTPPRGAKTVSIVTSDEMHDAVHRALHDCDVLVMCAAVSDYKPAARSRAENEETEDFVYSQINSDARHSRFAAETSSVSRRRFRGGNTRSEKQCAKKTSARKIAT